MKLVRYLPWVMFAALFSFVLAEAPPAPGFGDLDPDFRAWFSSPLALSLTVAVFTGYARTLLKLKGNAIRIAALVIGVALAGVGAAVGEIERNLITVILFGASAAIAAGGGWDILSGLIAIVAKVFGVVIPSGQLSTEPVNVRDTQVVVIEKETNPDTKVDVEVTHSRTPKED